LFGPAPHEYRALAATIAADAARVLAGFEELDRLARLGSGTLELERGEADLAAILSSTAAHLQPAPTSPARGWRWRCLPRPCRCIWRRRKRKGWCGGCFPRFAPMPRPTRCWR
jgi:signal transduction histidine kinase